MASILKYSSDSNSHEATVILERMLQGEKPDSIKAITARTIVELKVDKPEIYYRKARRAARSLIANRFKLPSNFTDTTMQKRYAWQNQEFKLGCIIAQKALGIKGAR